MLQRFQSFIKEKNLFQENDRLIVAVSGGADSVALCELCNQAGYSFKIAHCNFQLRGRESDRDEDFVKSLAEGYGVSLYTTRFETKTYSESQKVSTQVAARELRYQWFETLVNQENDGNPVFLLTAHHADDNIETLLMNFFKGTGIDGLAGIPVRNRFVARPLLFAWKTEIIGFLNKYDIRWVEDSSNLSVHYTRNYFRNELIPAIEKVFPGVKENLFNNIQRFNEVKNIYENAIALKKDKLVERKGDEFHIPVLKLLRTKSYRTIVFETVKNFGFLPSQLEDILHLLHAQSGKYVSSATHRIIKNRRWLIITPVAAGRSQHFLIHTAAGSTDFPDGALQSEILDWNQGDEIPADADIALADASEIEFPLLLRKWKQGDYFYPLGMSKKKKLSRFFIDQKLSVSDKERVWVLEYNKKIIWIPGYRLDHRFRVTEKTQRVLRLRVKWHQSAAAHP